MPAVLPFLVPALIGAAGATAITAMQASGAKKAQTMSANPTPDASQTVGDATANQTANAQNNGRAALISTSPSGVQGTDPTGRRKLIGND